jgi:hypothetical protein
MTARGGRREGEKNPTYWEWKGFGRRGTEEGAHKIREIAQAYK